MKIKVSLLTAAVLCIILLAFDTFIYFTLYAHLLTVEQGLLVNKAQAIAQYDAGHSGGKDGEDAPAAPFDWLKKYNQDGQTVLIVDANKKVLAHVGELPYASTLADFSPSKTQQTETTKSKHRLILTIVIPVLDVDEDGTRFMGDVILISDNNNVREYMQTLLTILVFGSAGAVFLAALAGYIVSATAVRPINQMIRLVQRIQADNLNERVQSPRGNDEIARLARTFNSMLARIEQSFDQQSRFVADASHEMRTPLTTIQGYASLLDRWGKDDPEILNKAIAVIQKESARMRDLANDLLTLASVSTETEDGQKLTHVSPVVDDVVDALAPLHPSLVFEKVLTPDLVAMIGQNHLKQVLINLIDNAIKHTQSGGRIGVKTELTDNYVTIHIEDSGRGNPPEDLPFVADRFYRVDKARTRRAGGSGLGLSIVKEIMQMYQGTIHIDSTLGKGTTVIIRIPAKKHG